MATMACSAEPKTGLPDANTDPVEAAQIKAQLVNSQLQNPWGMAFLPDGKILITEKLLTYRKIAFANLLASPNSQFL